MAVNSATAGEGYFRAITTLQADLEMRSAFQNLAKGLMPPRAAVLDFGCGPGIDAKFFAKQGFAVVGYDIDSEMRTFFKQHCADEIRSGQITSWECDYTKFLSVGDASFDGCFDLITANFAPLNLVGDLHALFAKFYALTRPNARILASVLNPYFVKELRYRWRLQNQWRLFRRGVFSFQQLPGKVFRRHPHNFAAEAAPYFALENVFRGGLHPSTDAYAPTQQVHRVRALDWLPLANYMFIFVLLRRADRVE